ncbi:MAG TPA: serine/threonine-protein kinase [Pyrinomonadaceae bacterium]|nr:serine/threonine-protein kinase [Pyrinomonadaceae bacterium]
MSGLQDYVGQVLDGKYHLERLLGQGGMGTVYLATHLGTGRYVALKLITAQLKASDEFVERFRREARAAGCLRHPNVVDVTDFGFAQVRGDSVAYLVMEYLDGCTLADVLSEEKRLPVEWGVDILEQVCSAVHEAHQQGIVHRDLKPENIWLEPNRLGGYRVKVLDFGIAKLAEQNIPDGLTHDNSNPMLSRPTQRFQSAQTESPLAATHQSGPRESVTSAPAGAVTAIRAESDTLLYTDREEPASNGPDHEGSETSTQRLEQPGLVHSSEPDDGDSSLNRDDGAQTLMMDQNTLRLGSATKGAIGELSAELTRVGAIMGTPLYMSPEQCAGKHLDARSDIYSLGVIAYQMLTGDPPFKGETSNVIRDHIETEPASLRERRKVPKRLADLVMSALAKDPADRPQSALAFATSLRAQSEGIGSLYRRAFALYSEYFPKFVRMSLIAHLPVIVTTVILVGLQFAERAQPRGFGVTRVSLIVALGIVGLLHVAAYFVAASAISGMTAVIITQLAAAPLKPVELRTAFDVLKKRWRPFLKTGIRVTLRIIIGYILLVIPGFIMQVRYALYAPVVLVEGLEKREALRRARELASRSWRTVIIVSLLQICIPMVVSFLFSIPAKSGPWRDNATFKILQQLSGLVNIFIVPLMSIVPALLYLKMRQLGGESLSAALAQIEELETNRTRWQERMRTRLTFQGTQ